MVAVNQPNGHFNFILTFLGFVLLFAFIHYVNISYFTVCVSYLSLIIILNISIFIHSEAATERSSSKLLFWISAKQIKTCLWKRPVLNKVAGYRSPTLLKLNFFTGVFQRFWSYNQLDTLTTAIFAEHLHQWLLLFIQ